MPPSSSISVLWPSAGRPKGSSPPPPASRLSARFCRCGGFRVWLSSSRSLAGPGSRLVRLQSMMRTNAFAPPGGMKRSPGSPQRWSLGAPVLPPRRQPGWSGRVPLRVVPSFTRAFKAAEWVAGASGVRRSRDRPGQESGDRDGGSASAGPGVRTTASRETRARQMGRPDERQRPPHLPAKDVEGIAASSVHSHRGRSGGGHALSRAQGQGLAAGARLTHGRGGGYSSLALGRCSGSHRARTEG